ncbi:MAG: 2-octaprenylphenol hydroxylase [Cellvibrionaceae bacterium]|jgi:2-octaprenylphenol hydroxylase
MSESPLELECDIAIAGAGVIGAAFAALLLKKCRNRTLSVVLIDQNDVPQTPDLQAQPPYFDPRVMALSQHSISILNEIGIWSGLEAQRVCHYQHMVVWDDEGTGHIEFSAQELNQSYLGVIVENSLLINELRACLHKSEAVTVIRHQSIVTVETIATDNIEKKRLVLSDGTKIKADLVIAADGAHSTIRRQLNMPIRSWEYGHNAIVTSVECEHSHQNTAWQSFLPTGPLAFLPLGDASEKYCSIVWSVETEVAEHLMALEDQEFKQQLGKAFGWRLGEIVQVDRRRSFPLVQRHAIDYVAPQVALVGDAAHTIHPLAGQGVNLGFFDIQALVMEIERALERRLALTDPSILRRYQRHRKKHNLEAMLIMEALKRLFGHRDPVIRWARNTGLNLVNRSKITKHWLAKQAMGL